MTNITTKPFVSQAQQRFAFATRQPWARRWARETNFARLPERKADDSYTPPAGARGNARKVLEWRRKYGARVRGMTRVGWGRARQLASGRPISLAIVKRMAAFTRHRQNATVAPEYQDEPWRDAGYVAWLGWGGDTGIDWARGISERARTKGEQIAPGITRIHGNLCNVHGKYGPCDAALSGKPKKGGKKGAGKKPKEPAKTPEQRSQERAASKAASPSDYLVVEDRAKPSTWHLQVRRSGKLDHNLMGAAWAALHGGYRGNVYQGPQKSAAIAALKRLYESEQMPVPAEKSGLCVFKDAHGKFRWILRTTTAFEDRDREILSTKALEADAQRMTATRQFGPLRYWHVGAPDPFNADAPWGAGLDLGMCDYSTVIGRTSVESGTFFDDRIGAAIAAKADQYEASPGFFHPSDQPDASGTFWTIRRFERSLVPRQFGRASNRFTGLAVGRTSKSMDLTEYNRRVQAFLTDMQALGVPAEASAEVIGTLQHQEKSADDQRVAFKDADCPQDITINGIVYTAKCADQKAAAPAPAAEDEAAPTEDVGDEAMDEEEPAGGLTLSEDDLTAIAERVGQVIASGLTEALAPLVGAMNIEAKMAGMMGDLKGALGGYVAKKDAESAEQRQQLADLAQRTADLAQQTGTLATTVKQATVKVDELLGEQPEVTPGRASTSPTTQINPTNPADQTLLAAAKTQFPPDNPFADILSQLFNQPSP